MTKLATVQCPSLVLTKDGQWQALCPGRNVIAYPIIHSNKSSLSTGSVWLPQESMAADSDVHSLLSVRWSAVPGVPLDAHLAAVRHLRALLLPDC